MRWAWRRRLRGYFAAAGFIRTCCGLAVAVLLSGCGGDQGPPRVAIEGEVRLDERLLEQGSILFIPIEAEGPQVGSRVTGGRYQLSRSAGPVVGKHRVEIRAEERLGYDPTVAEETVQHIGEPRRPNPIPAEYNDRSTLTVETTVDGSNQFDFQLRTRR